MKKLALLIFIAIPMFTWAGVQEDFPALRPIGKGEFRWLGFPVYQASLLADTAPPRSDSVIALRLTYARSISRERLVSTSVDEIERLFPERYDAATLQRWKGWMEQAFVDVSAGDVITGVYLPATGCRFYLGSQLRLDVRDAEFAKAFFGIWLDKRSKDQTLRSQLLGSAP